jgi:hypothetical protein
MVPVAQKKQLPDLASLNLGIRKFLIGTSEMSAFERAVGVTLLNTELQIKIPADFQTNVQYAAAHA